MRLVEHYYFRVKGGLGNQLFILAKVLEMSGDQSKIWVEFVGTDGRNFVCGPLFAKIGAREVKTILGTGLCRMIFSALRTATSSDEVYCKLGKITFSDSYLIDQFVANLPHVEGVARLLGVDLALPLVDHTIAVHVRLGDFQDMKFKHYQVCNGEYYRLAIRYLQQHHGMRPIMLFSDQPNEAREMLESIANKITVFDPAGVMGPLDTLKELAKYKYVVTANSTFSYWGAIMNWTQKSIVMPRYWTNDRNRPVAVPDLTIAEKLMHA